MSLGTVQHREPKITRVSVGSTEVSHALRAHARGFLVRCQEFEELRLAFESGETADSSDFLVLRVNDTYWEEDVYSGGETWTLYLRAPDVASPVGVTVLEWL